MSEAEDVVEEEVEGGEGVALRGMSQAAEKAREGKEPVRRRCLTGIWGVRVGDESGDDMVLDVGEDEGEEDEGRILVVVRRTRRIIFKLVGAGLGWRSRGCTNSFRGQYVLLEVNEEGDGVGMMLCAK